MSNIRPIIAITMGDASGIGPEVVVKALSDKAILDICQPVIIGDYNILQKSIALIREDITLYPIQNIEQIDRSSQKIDVLDLHNLGEEDVTIGQICKACGKASVEYIIQAARLALHKYVAAIVTAPINKEATRLAGYGELGHLELFAHYTDSIQYATMLTSGPLRVVHLTTHYSLKEALGFITRDHILNCIKLTQLSFRKWGIENPRIGIAALNPHGGEGGIMGREEIEEISPAIRDAVKDGINVRGPYPADTIFNRAINGEFDVVIAMYHDQGHIPIKVYGFEKSVSVAMGLPFIRTSVDHGTAFDIAGKGIANAESMKEAIKVAVSLILHKRL